MSATAARALSGYRRLFRARNKLFVGDVRALAESRLAIRAEFDKNLTVGDPSHLEGLLVMIDEAEDMMLHGIVQGSLNERGNYGTYQNKSKFLKIVNCSSLTQPSIFFVNGQRSISKQNMQTWKNQPQRWSQSLPKPSIR
jgi:hypothetical protein